jgi:hypothetical protein
MKVEEFITIKKAMWSCHFSVNSFPTKPIILFRKAGLCDSAAAPGACAILT